MFIIIIEKSNSVKYSLKSVEELKCTLKYIFKTKEGSKGTEGKKDMTQKTNSKMVHVNQPYQYYLNVNGVTAPTKSIDSPTG